MDRARRAARRRTPAPEVSSAQPASSQSGNACPKQGQLGELAFLHKAASLGFDVLLPYGRGLRYDVVVDNGRRLWRVQVKTTDHMLNGLYQVGVHHRANGKQHTYTPAEVDFVAVYILPEQTWYILPVREVVGHQSLLFRPRGYARRDPYARYREAWHLLRQTRQPRLRAKPQRALSTSSRVAVTSLHSVIPSKERSPARGRSCAVEGPCVRRRPPRNRSSKNERCKNRPRHLT